MAISPGNQIGFVAGSTRAECARLDVSAVIATGYDTEAVVSKSLKVQIVEQARALIEYERHWCRGELARDGKGLSVSPTDRSVERRCALGALIAAAYQMTNDLDHAHNLALKAIRPIYGTATLVNINDLRGHAAVVALLDEVIAKS